jgi:hypothetical protein
MPRIGELFGIFFYLYFQEHGVPHIHAIYQDNVAVLDLKGMLLEGKLPRKKMKIAKKFIADYAEDIQEMIDDINYSKVGKKKAPKIKNLNKPKL